MGKWEVVGGIEHGGIIVRKDSRPKAQVLKDRLATGSLVEEVVLDGERLHYKLVDGKGPKEGWASIKLEDKDLMVPVDDPRDDVGGPGEPSDNIVIDEDLKAKIVADAKRHPMDFYSYCPKYKVFYPQPPETCTLRVFCFHLAGGTETIFTTGKDNPLVTWAKESGDVELVAIDYPGRGKLQRAEMHTSTDTLAPRLLAVLYEKLTDGTPYIIWGHSVGTLVSFEVLMLARKIGVPMPKAAFWTGFGAPHMPETKRPWRPNRRLNDWRLREELMNWDKEHFCGAGKVVFQDLMWNQTEPMMRADFSLFDQYKFTHDQAPPFNFPIHAWHMEKELYNTPDMIAMWKDWTTGTFDNMVVPDMGHLTCLIGKPDLKNKFLQMVLDVIEDKYYIKEQFE